MTIRTEAARLQAAGYCVMGLDLTMEAQSNKKRLHFKTNWQHARRDTCLTSMFEADDNALALVTGECSDLLAVDLDTAKEKDIKAGLKDAVVEMESLIQTHGLDASVPMARTPSGGIHMLFKLSTSLAAGLLNASNGVKLAGMTMDVRADGGCLLCHPSGYPTGQKYVWEKPIVPSADLTPAPMWLIGLLNQRKTTQPSSLIEPTAKRQRTIQVDSDSLLTGKVQRELTKMGPSLQMDKVWPRLGGIDFCMADRTCACPLCGNVHASNQYKARVVIDSAWLFGNYSTSCKSQAFGWSECNVLTKVIASPKTDDSFCGLLMAAYMVQHRSVKYTAADRFLAYNGVVWEPIHIQVIKGDIKLLISQVLTPLILNIPKNEETTPKINALRAARSFIERSHNVNSVIQTFQTYAFDVDIEDKMDTNPDLLGVANGVIDLPTGQLTAGRGNQRLSIQLARAYHDRPTPMIDAFFNSIFNDDQDTIAYVQRLLGYGITGHTRQQVWAIWTGSGSNGKSLLMSVLMKLLGPFAVAMPAEVLFESGKTTAGACTPHLQCLIKKRMGFKDEGKSDKANILNEELIKNVTGTTAIATKPHYREMMSFVPSHLPILLCNKKPNINIQDSAMMRRIVVIPFHNIYTDPDSKQMPYDPDNPRHRLRDACLEERLSSDDGQEQLLTWLVHGAQAWYKQGLGAMPQVIGAAFDNYREENDHLSTFIAECCVTGDALFVNAADLLKAYNTRVEGQTKQKDFKDMMLSKGYKQSTNKGRCYIGLAIHDDPRH